MIPTLTPLTIAEQASSAAQEALASHYNLRRGVLEAMLVAGRAVLNSLSGDARDLVHFEHVSEGLPGLLDEAFELLIQPLEEHAEFMSALLHDLQCEQFDAAHAAKASSDQAYAEAAE